MVHLPELIIYRWAKAHSNAFPYRRQSPVLLCLKCSKVDLRLLRKGEAVQQGSQNLFLADRQEKFKAGFRKFLQIRQIELRCNRGLTWDDFSDLYQT